MTTAIFHNKFIWK